MVADGAKAGAAPGHPGGMDALRTIKIQVPDRTQPGFAEECRRQARAVAAVDVHDTRLDAFMDEALTDLDDADE